VEDEKREGKEGVAGTSVSYFVPVGGGGGSSSLSFCRPAIQYEQCIAEALRTSLGTTPDTRPRPVEWSVDTHVLYYMYCCALNHKRKTFDSTDLVETLGHVDENVVSSWLPTLTNVHKIFHIHTQCNGYLT
jgi:hypothetical protein